MHYLVSEINVFFLALEDFRSTFGQKLLTYSVHEKASNLIMQAERLLGLARASIHPKGSMAYDLQMMANDMPSPASLPGLSLSHRETVRVFDEQEAELRKLFFALREQRPVCA